MSAMSANPKVRLQGEDQHPWLCRSAHAVSPAPRMLPKFVGRSWLLSYLLALGLLASLRYQSPCSSSNLHKPGHRGVSQASGAWGTMWPENCPAPQISTFTGAVLVEPISSHLGISAPLPGENVQLMLMMLTSCSVKSAQSLGR